MPDSTSKLTTVLPSSDTQSNPQALEYIAKLLGKGSYTVLVLTLALKFSDMNSVLWILHRAPLQPGRIITILPTD